MPSLKLADFKKNNIWVTLGVVFAVVVLLILPDFFKNRDRNYVEKLQTRSSKLEKGRTSISVTANQQSPVIQPVSQQPSSDSERTNSEGVIAGTFDNLQETYSGFLKGVSGAGPRTTRRLQEFAIQYGTTPEMDLEYINISPEEQNWKRLKSRSVKGAIKKSQNATKRLAKNLKVKYPNIASDLESFVFLLDGFYDAEEQGLDAVGVVSAIQDQEYQLTQGMLSNKVPRIAMIDWARVSLSKLYGNTSLLEYKIKSIPAFSPNFRLTMLKIYINKKNLQGESTELKSYRLDLSAMLRGSDLKSVTLIHQGNWSRKVTPRKDLEDPEIYHLKVKNIDAAGIYRFVFTDQFGAQTERLYSFDPRYRAVNWNDEDRNTVIYNVPSQAGVGTVFFKERLDLTGRLDSYYRYNNSRESFGFTTPQDNAFQSFSGGAGSNTF